MKKLKIFSLILPLLMLLGFNQSLHAQKPPKKKTVSIQTNGLCGACKNRIETALKKEKGVIFATYNLESSRVTVQYKTKKTNVETLREAIANVGYSADQVKPDEEARKKLNVCCTDPEISAEKHKKMMEEKKKAEE